MKQLKVEQNRRVEFALRQTKNEKDAEAEVKNV
jgi:hypothetical protein